MARVAATLGRRARRRKPPRAGARPMPSLWLMTDPRRTPGLAALVEALPRGAGVIFRAFGAPDALSTARSLRRLTRARGLVLLIGADARLAAACGADGVHLPQRLMGLAPRLRRGHPGWRITVAAHGAAAIVAANRLGADGVVVSAVFPSRSPSAGRPLGVVRFEALARRSRAPVIALGGIGGATAGRLRASAAGGLAGIDGFLTAGRRSLPSGSP
jgi:thiamine-phosphate pyrophosphorylase